MGVIEKAMSMEKAAFEDKTLVTTWRSRGPPTAIVMSQVWRTRIAINIPSSPCVFLIASRVVIVAVALIRLKLESFDKSSTSAKKIHLKAEQFKSPQFPRLQRWSFPNLLHDVHLLDYGRIFSPHCPVTVNWMNGLSRQSEKTNTFSTVTGIIGPNKCNLRNCALDKAANLTGTLEYK